MTALLPPHAGTTFSDALRGDPDALDALLRRHRGAVEAVCFRRLRSRTDAEDAVQETMVRGMRALVHVEDPARLKSYLCRIAERVCLDMLRAGAQAMPHEPEERSDGSDEPETIALERERARLVHQTLQALSERQATALWMRDALGEPVPAVAERLGVTEGSARVLLTRARAKMRDHWKAVAALIPGSGIKLPATAKILHLGPLAIPAAVPALALLAAVTIAPVAYVALQDNAPTQVRQGQSAVTTATTSASWVTIAGGLDTSAVSVTVTEPSATRGGGTATTTSGQAQQYGVNTPAVSGLSLSTTPTNGQNEDEAQVGGGSLPEIGLYDPRLEDFAQETGIAELIDALPSE